jgi:hypothetical protein
MLHSSFPGTSSCNWLENTHGETAEELLTLKQDSIYTQQNGKNKDTRPHTITKLCINCTLCSISMRITTQVYFDIIHFSSIAYITCTAS